MGHILDLIFKSPPMPEINLPLAARLVPGVKEAISQAFVLAYHRGVYDGLVAGILLTLLFVPSIRGKVAKGVSDAADAIVG